MREVPPFCERCNRALTARLRKPTSGAPKATLIKGALTLKGALTFSGSAAAEPCVGHFCNFSPPSVRSAEGPVD
jgi:hypothetical protein